MRPVSENVFDIWGNTFRFFTTTMALEPDKAVDFIWLQLHFITCYEWRVKRVTLLTGYWMLKARVEILLVGIAVLMQLILQNLYDK